MTFQISRRVPVLVLGLMLAMGAQAQQHDLAAHSGPTCCQHAQDGTRPDCCQKDGTDCCAEGEACCCKGKAAAHEHAHDSEHAHHSAETHHGDHQHANGGMCPMSAGDASCCQKMASADGSVEAAALVADARVQHVSVKVTSSGYSPAVLDLVAGIPAEITFTRETPSGCARQVHAPELGIAKTELPQGEPITIRFTPEREGTFAFMCGMDMMRGTIRVAAH